jgi:hypothetical protein
VARHPYFLLPAGLPFCKANARAVFYIIINKLHASAFKDANRLIQR